MSVLSYIHASGTIIDLRRRRRPATVVDLDERARQIALYVDTPPAHGPGVDEGKHVHAATDALAFNVTAIGALRRPGSCQRCTSTNQVRGVPGQADPVRWCSDCRGRAGLRVVGPEGAA